MSQTDTISLFRGLGLVTVLSLRNIFVILSFILDLVIVLVPTFIL